MHLPTLVGLSVRSAQHPKWISPTERPDDGGPVPLVLVRAGVTGREHAGGRELAADGAVDAAPLGQGLEVRPLSVDRLARLRLARLIARVTMNRSLSL